MLWTLLVYIRDFLWRLFGRRPPAPPPAPPQTLPPAAKLPPLPAPPPRPTPQSGPKPSARFAHKPTATKADGVSPGHQQPHPPTGSQGRQPPPPAQRRAHPPAKAKPPPSAQVIDRLIEGLPDRTLLELRQQWLNVLAYPQTDPGVARIRKAILAEWGKRTRRANKPSDYFRWPSTKLQGTGGGDQIVYNEQGLLKFMGYQVGATNGECEATRRKILDTIFEGELPPLNGPDYMQGWARPGSPQRLQRLATELARFTKNAKSKDSANMDVAVSDWEDDLAYLYETYYKRKFGFAWPNC